MATFKASYLRRTFAKKNTEQMLMQQWKDYDIDDCIRNLACACGDVTTKCVNSIWKKTFKRFVHDYKEFAKDEEVVKISKAVVQTANNSNLGVDEDDTE